jgi:hypothetical protein
VTVMRRVHREVGIAKTAEWLIQRPTTAGPQCVSTPHNQIFPTRIIAHLEESLIRRQPCLKRQSVLMAKCQGSLLANGVPQEMLEQKESDLREGCPRDLGVRIGHC